MPTEGRRKYSSRYKFVPWLTVKCRRTERDGVAEGSTATATSTASEWASSSVFYLDAYCSRFQATKFNGNLFISMLHVAGATLTFNPLVYLIDSSGSTSTTLAGPEAGAGRFGNYSSGIVTSLDGQRMYVSFAEAALNTTQRVDLSYYSPASITSTPTFLLNNMLRPPSGNMFFTPLYKLDPAPTYMYVGGSVGTNAGSSWGLFGTSESATRSRTFSSPTHSGRGSSVCEFDSKFFWGGQGADTAQVMVWRTDTLDSAETWEGSKSGLSTLISGKLAGPYSGSVYLHKTASNASRMYAFIEGCNKIGFRVQGASATWSYVSMPSGEYFPPEAEGMQPSFDGKVYFPTSTVTPQSLGGTLRIRWVDDSGGMSLVGTLPSPNVMFPDFSATYVNVQAITPVQSLSYTVSSLLVTVFGAHSSASGWYWGGAYVEEFVRS